MNFALKFFNAFLLLVLVVGSVNVSTAQRAEEIMTESSEPANEVFLDGVVEKRLMVENRVLPYEPIREADIAWEKRIWRVIDTREKRNLVFRYPEKSFFSIIQQLANDGEINVFRDDRFTEIIESNELTGILNRVDTSVVFDPETYEEQIKITTEEINWEDIKRYRVKEVWFFDEETSRMRVRILGIAPIKEEYDEDTGLFKYEAPLFWVYYPQIRESLSKFQVFNDSNDAAPMTWYDLFEARVFASYIYKQSNVLDLRLKDYFEESDQLGIDVLLESQKIKNDLFNFEHDLWEF
ncbi:type IX secretion system ring subunit PorN/GldN [Portibacter marinus]|uniref:type IX secretion system ring protein PorN/GldN n=1 Tax=Portibacter marinus TaxID=2898660 RepID=UPI001F43FCF8|nr:gliding motility protein GldN [Portibacter marinus]